MTIQKNILEHFRDLRNILVRMLIIFTIIFCISFYFVDFIFELFLKLFINQNGQFQDVKLVFSKIESAFFSKMLVSFNSALIVLIPYFFLEVMLYFKEVLRNKNYFTVLYLLSVIFYFLSIFASIKFILPIVFNFFLSIGFFDVNFYIDASVFIEFIMKVIFAFAIVFEFPVILLILSLLGIIKQEFLIKKRKIVFVISFIAGAILTPPDVVSQIICAVLIYLFFELVILILRFKA